MSQTTKQHQGESATSPRTGLTPRVLPSASADVSRTYTHTGVSTQYVPETNLPSSVPQPIHRPSQVPHWYALRTTYGREKLASEHITAHGGTVFYPTIMTTKLIDGKRRHVEESRIPNIFFIYGTEQEAQEFVYDNVNLPYLRFYYKHTHNGNAIRREPLIIPDNQIESLRIICEAEANHDILLYQEEIQKFKAGEKVRIIEGDFKGVIGIVARFRGQQRVGIVLDGLLTAVTAYIPNAFLEKIDSQP